jgi:hypothetical protein
MSASVLRAANANDAQARWNIVEHLADGFVDPMDLTTTTGAGVGSDIECHVVALEMIRQTETALDVWRWPRLTTSAMAPDRGMFAARRNTVSERA